jgi:Uma2 family endonuclease
MLLQDEQLYTVEEFFAIATLPENEGRRLELEGGVIVEMAASTQENTVTAMRIGHFLNTFVIPRNLGYVTGADGGFKLGKGRARQPDTAFISKQRHPKLEGVNFPITPDLAVEIVSEDEDIFKKALEYLHAGTKQVWAVYTDQKMVYVMRLDEDGELRSRGYGMDATLDGGEVLPGFSLPVRQIFPS